MQKNSNIARNQKRNMIWGGVTLALWLLIYAAISLGIIK